MVTRHHLKTLAIIPARAGSKRLPGKNIKVLLDKPLIGWTVEQALECEYFTKVIISTDCQHIASIAETFGAEVPFMRPDELAHDHSSSFSLVEHALDFYERKGERFDVVALLEPTSPLRAKHDLNRAMSAFFDHYDTHDALISVGKLEREHPKVIKRITKEKYVRSFGYSEESEAFFPYGVIYATKTEKLLENKTFYQDNSLPYVIERWQNFEVDDEVDFMCIEKVMGAYLAQL